MINKKNWESRILRNLLKYIHLDNAVHSLCVEQADLDGIGRDLPRVGEQPLLQHEAILAAAEVAAAPAAVDCLAALLQCALAAVRGRLLTRLGLLT